MNKEIKTSEPKSNWFDIIFLVLLSIIPIYFTVSWSNKDDNSKNIAIENLPTEISFSGVISNTGISVTGSSILPIQTGSINKTIKEEFDGMKSNGTYIEFLPKIQPSLASNYSLNTSRMLDYMEKNSIRVKLDKPIQKGYLYYKIRNGSNSQKSSDKLFFYLANNRISGYLVLSKSIYSKVNYLENGVYYSEYIFDVRKLPILPWKDVSIKSYNLIDNYFSYFGIPDYISSFYVNQDGGTISKIGFAYGE